MPNPIRILIADDHLIVREGIKAVLTDDEMVVVGEAANGLDVVEAARELQPDVVLLDIQMPGQSGIEACKAILSILPKAKLLALTTFQDEKMILECLKAGFHGYVIKDVERMDLRKYVRAVLRGEAIIDPKVAGVLMNRVREGTPSAKEKVENALTPQQIAILRLVSQGFSNREIGAQLSLSENTVKGHIAEILDRMEARNRVDAALKATSRGWL